jgi:hypothetical protein
VADALGAVPDGILADEIEHLEGTPSSLLEVFKAELTRREARRTGGAV